MHFVPFRKENILREIRERVKKYVPFKSGLTKAITITAREDDPYWVEQQKLKELVKGKVVYTK
jgi:hypothetical protein